MHFPEPRRLTIIHSLTRSQDCAAIEETAQSAVDSEPNMSEKMKKYLLNTVEERRQSSIEIRYAFPKDGYSPRLTQAESSNDPSANQQALWFRSRAKVPHDDAFQKCVLAYASDFSFIGELKASVAWDPS
jgi:acyl-CoA thioesterase 8